MVAEKMTFFRWPGKIQFFLNKYFIPLEDIKNYLDIIFYEKNLKNWIFPGQKMARKLPFPPLYIYYWSYDAIN